MQWAGRALRVKHEVRGLMEICHCELTVHYREEMRRDGESVSLYWKNSLVPKWAVDFSCEREEELGATVPYIGCDRTGVRVTELPVVADKTEPGLNTEMPWGPVCKCVCVA